jgi:hypothetical protein
MSVKNRNSIVTDGLVFYVDAGNEDSYPGTGTAVTDLIGSDSGVLTNGTAYSTNNGGSFNFDGVNDYLTSGLDDFTSSLSSGHTFDIWMKTSTTSVSEPFGFLNQSDSLAYRFKINSQSDSSTYSSGKAALYLRATSGQIFSFDCDAGINDGSWHNISFVVNNAGTHSANAYLDGSSISTTTMQSTFPTNWGVSSYPAWVGAVNNRGAFLRGVDGSIAQVKIYNKALSSTEVLQNYNALKNRFI